MPRKTPQLPRVPKVSHKKGGGSACLSPSGSQTPHILLNILICQVWQLFTRLKVVYIFFSLLYDNLFSSSSPQVLGILSPFQKKLHCKIKEQWIRKRKGGEKRKKKTAACEAPSLIFKLIYNYVQHCTHTVNGDINTLRWRVMYRDRGVLVL